MQTALAFIVIFGSLVFFHELGHFLFAKRAGILVREFAIGMGPKILGITKGETIYTIRLLPIGGYVRMAGEDMDQIELQPGYRVGLILNDQNVVKKIVLNQKAQYQNILFMEVERADLAKALWIEGYDEDEQLKRFSVARDAVIIENGKETILAPYDRQFNSKSLGHRSMTIFAGPLFNFILAFFIFVLLAMLQGIPTYEPVVTGVNADSPAQKAGLLPGDLVTEINGDKIVVWDDLAAAVQAKPEEPLDFIVQRNGEEIPLKITPEIEEVKGQKVGMIGISYRSPVEQTFNPIKVVSYGAEQTYKGTTLILTLLGNLITGEFSIDDLAGPVGIYQATDEVAKFGIYSLMYWGAMLSINLGIMNLLPLPALDGGRLLFFGYEAIRGKPVDRQKEGLIHFVGIVLLMLLMVVVTWNDIQRLFF
jgi:regulator of sigma E protease